VVKVLHMRKLAIAKPRPMRVPEVLSRALLDCLPLPIRLAKTFAVTEATRCGRFGSALCGDVRRFAAISGQLPGWVNFSCSALGSGLAMSVREASKPSRWAPGRQDMLNWNQVWCSAQTCHG